VKIKKKEENILKEILKLGLQEEGKVKREREQKEHEEELIHQKVSLELSKEKELLKRREQIEKQEKELEERIRSATALLHQLKLEKEKR